MYVSQRNICLVALQPILDLTELWQYIVTKHEGIGVRQPKVPIPVLLPVQPHNLKYVDFSNCFFINKIGTTAITTCLIVARIKVFKKNIKHLAPSNSSESKKDRIA